MMFFSQKTINGSGCEKQQSALSHEASAWKSWKFNDLGQYAFFNKVELTFFLFFCKLRCQTNIFVHWNKSSEDGGNTWWILTTVGVKKKNRINNGAKKKKNRSPTPRVWCLRSEEQTVDSQLKTIPFIPNLFLTSAPASPGWPLCHLCLLPLICVSVIWSQTDTAAQGSRPLHSQAPTRVNEVGFFFPKCLVKYWRQS